MFNKLRKKKHNRFRNVFSPERNCVLLKFPTEEQRIKRHLKGEKQKLYF